MHTVKKIKPFLRLPLLHICKKDCSDLSDTTAAHDRGRRNIDKTYSIRGICLTNIGQIVLLLSCDRTRVEPGFVLTRP